MSNIPIDHDKLGIVVEIARAGSLSGAALTLGSSQPYISKALTQIESALGERLFRRTGRGMVLTDFGEAVAPRIRKWLGESEALIDEFRVLAGSTTGVVRIATVPAVSSPLMSALFMRMRRDSPGIRLRLMEGHAEQIHTWLNNGNADIGITLQYEPRTENPDIALMEFDVYLCGAPGNPITGNPTVDFNTLANIPMAVHSSSGVMHRFLEKLCAERGFRLNTVIEVNSLSIKRDIAAAGGAYALMCYKAINEDVIAGRLQVSRVVNPSITQYIGLRFPQNGLVTQATRVSIKHLRFIVKESIEASSLNRGR